MKNTIAVIWGTPTDTLFWKQLLLSLGYKKIGECAVAKSPQEQNYLQQQPSTILQQKCLQICKKFKNQWYKRVLIYCNSLSSVIDIKILEKESSISIVSPIQVYEDIRKRYKHICVIAANSSGTSLAEKELSRNSESHIITFWFLELVEKIETSLPPGRICKDMGLEKITQFAEINNSEVILLSCTHFPYIKEELQKYTYLPILDLDTGLKKILSWKE